VMWQSHGLNLFFIPFPSDKGRWFGNRFFSNKFKFPSSPFLKE
jgi:hypothetical protein